jgi:hypothetical protein
MASAQFRLLNGSGRIAYLGDLCKMHATRKKTFDLAVPGDAIIGTAAETIGANSWGLLNPQGMVDWSNVINKPQRGPRVFVNTAQPDPSALLPGDIWINPSIINTTT